MKHLGFLALSLLSSACSAQDKTSAKTFGPVAVVNRIEFQDAKLNQPRFSCGFLVLYKNDTLAVTARHLLKLIKPPEMRTLAFDGLVKSWSFFPLDKPQEMVVADKLLNEDKQARLESKATYEDDWLVFSLRSNHSRVQPLSIRTSPLVPGEKLYVVGWTRHQESGPQRVYEFEYYKTMGQRLLLKEVLVPAQLGGLSGAPVLDEQGRVVALVSNGTVDPATGQKFFSPCAISTLVEFLDQRPH